MNDFIKSQPVGCFYTPIYTLENSKEKISYLFGQNRNFKKEDNIPSQTFWYNYSENFMILDYEYSKINPLIHIIKNNSIKNTVFANELNLIDFFNNEKVITFNGEELKINSLKDLNLFLYDLVELDGLCEYKNSKIDIYRYNLLKRNEDIEMLNLNTEHCLSLLSKYDKEAWDALITNHENNIIPRDLSDILSDVDRYKIDIINDTKLINEIKNIVLERVKKEFDTLYLENEKLEKEIEKDIEILEEKHKEKWFNSEFQKEKKFGEYLECYRYLKLNQNIIENETNFKNELNICTYNFSTFIKQNNNIVNKYLSWSNFDNDTQEIIKQIVDDIIKE